VRAPYVRREIDDVAAMRLRRYVAAGVSAATSFPVTVDRMVHDWPREPVRVPEVGTKDVDTFATKRDGVATYVAATVEDAASDLRTGWWCQRRRGIQGVG
jgi:hypothetical protein